MELSYIDKDGYEQEVNFDVIKFFELIAKEAKYKKAGRGKHIHQILNNCIRASASQTNIYGTKLDSLIRIELLNFK